MEFERVMTRGVAQSIAVSRRAALRLAAGAAGLTLLPRWVAASHEQITPFPGETFVGEIEDPAAFVAVVLGEAKPGAVTREARALVYGDPHNEINEWFNAGSAGSGELDLRGKNGGALTAGLTADSVAGTIRFADGRALPFTAKPAAGTAGIYTVTAALDGRLSGTSAEGAQLEGQIAPELLNDLPAELSRYLAVGLLTPPTGEPRAFALTVTAFPVEPLQARFIAAADGRIKGGIDVHPMEIVFQVDKSISFVP